MSVLDVIIPFRGGDHWREQNFDIVRYLWSQAGLSVIDADSGHDVFNRSASRNVAAAQSKAEYLLVADADTFVESWQVFEALKMMGDEEDPAPWVIPYANGFYYNLSQECTQRIWHSPNARGKWELSWEHQLLSWAGVLLVRREDFEKVGGYDERFVGWGHEDVAFRIKLDAEVGQHRRTGGSAYHLWHPVDPNQTFNAPDERRNRRLFNLEYKQKYGWKDERLG